METDKMNQRQDPTSAGFMGALGALGAIFIVFVGLPAAVLVLVLAAILGVPEWVIPTVILGGVAALSIWAWRR